MGASGAVTRVLVVDDSAVVRQTLTKLLSDAGGFEVEVAADPIIAMRRMADARPDVIVLDLEMPRMDGLTFLGKIMAEDPIPVVVCSSFSRSAGRAAITALSAGAVDIVTKPELGVRDFLEESAVAIVDAVRAAARARLPGRIGPAAQRPAPRAAPAASPATPAEWPIVAVGASTGGTEALAEILRAMPADGPSMLIVQHMPEGFTRAFAERLNASSAMEVKEAANDDPVRPALALIAPGNRHLRLRGRAPRHRVEVSGGPFIARHRPSVDALFESVARSAGAAAVGVLLTGMGDDGAQGLLAMRDAGARTLVQDEASSVVFGMPRAAIQRGAAQEVLSLHAIIDAILAASV
jgi:two-component system chemotaxis response regulator CheB